MPPIALPRDCQRHHNTSRFSVAAVAVFWLVWLPSGAAVAEDQVAEPNAYVTADVNLRAGPDTDFPVLVVVPEQAAVTIYDCVDDLSWCDLSYGEERGWVSAQYLQAFY